MLDYKRSYQNSYLRLFSVGMFKDSFCMFVLLAFAFLFVQVISVFSFVFPLSLPVIDMVLESMGEVRL